MKKLTKVMFLFLIIMCLLVSALPSAVSAAAVEAGGTLTCPITEGTSAESPTANKERTMVAETMPSGNVSIIQEDVSLRKEYEKHFLMSDGSYQVALYNEPVHQRENGKWVEIDNTLTLQMAADGTARYSTANGLTDVSFSRCFDDQLVTVQQDDYSLSWGVQAVSDNLCTMASASVELTQPVQAELAAIDMAAFSAEEQKTVAAKSSSSIQYRNALWQDVDLEYIILPSRIKENIILQSPQDISCYVVTVYTKNLSARLLKNRQIEFYNSSNEVVFTMSSPYMYDSAAELSENITVEMTSKGDGYYFIKMTPDEQWLNDKSRMYPVVIDPEVSTDTTQQNIIDNYVLEGSGVQNNNLDRLYIGKKSGSTARAYIKFAAMPTIPSGSTISAAIMTVQIYAGTSTAYNASAYKVTGGDWASGTITWANKPAAATLLASNISHNSKTRYTFSCKTAVQSWYSGSTTGQNANYGIMLRYYDETINDYNSFYSADYLDETKRPCLVITYASNSSISVDVTNESGYLLVGKTQKATCTTSPSGLAVTWASSNPKVATVSSSGVITGKSEGLAKISATYYHTLSDTTYSDYVYINVYSSCGLKDGAQYHIMNCETKRLLSLESFVDTNGTNVYTRERSNIYSSRWRLEEQSDGRFQLVNAYSPTAKVLHVSETNVDIYTNNNSESTKFTVYRLNSGTYTGLYYLRYGSYFVAQDENNNVYLTSSPSNKAIWSFSPVSEGHADIFSHDYYYYDAEGKYCHFNTAVNNTYFKSVFGTALGYTANSATNSTASSAYSTLRSNNQQIFVFRGHGNAGIISFYKEGNIATGGIYADSAVASMYSSRDDKRYISDLNSNDLCSLRCVLYLGCSTGDDITINGTTYNTVDATYEKGAHFVLGTTETIYNSQGNNWLKYFLDYIQSGCSIEEACQNANDDLGIIEVPTGISTVINEVEVETMKAVYGLPTYSIGDDVQYLKLP